MKTAAIIAEYNPFHNGHAHHIAAVRQWGATHIVAVMSGNFVQRGTPAIMDKGRRVEAALWGGVDLVVELPLPYAMATAERFAFGAVSIVEALGVVDALSFGCEAGGAAPLEAAARWIDDPAVAAGMQPFLRRGDTFAKARQRAVEKAAGPRVGQVLSAPNNILAVEYIRRLRMLSSSIEVVAIPRVGAEHDSPCEPQRFAGRFLASASAIRGWAEQGELSKAFAAMPEAGARLLREDLERGAAPARFSEVERGILSVLRSMGQDAFARLPDCSEGLENRLWAASHKAVDLEQLYALCKSKRYSLARVRRLATAAFLGVDGDLCRLPPPYIRVLGFTPAGARLLAHIKKAARLPLSHSLAKLAAMDGDAQRFARLEGTAWDQYALMLPTPLPCGGDYTRRPVKVGPEPL